MQHTSESYTLFDLRRRSNPCTMPQNFQLYQKNVQSEKQLTVPCLLLNDPHIWKVVFCLLAFSVLF